MHVIIVISEQTKTTVATTIQRKSYQISKRVAVFQSIAFQMCMVQSFEVTNPILADIMSLPQDSNTANRSSYHSLNHSQCSDYSKCDD